MVRKLRTLEPGINVMGHSSAARIMHGFSRFARVLSRVCTVIEMRDGRKS